MPQGMQWFDNSKTELSVKLEKASAYYEKKYGVKPNVCLVHPSELKKDVLEVEINGIKVRPYRPVLPGHYWIEYKESEVSTPADIESG